jgi:multicomponent Na+:H+ antiporter subunit B
MTSLILRTSTPFLSPLLLVVSVLLLLRGHNEPGGGFVGGLIAAAAFALYAIAFDVQHAQRRLRLDPHVLTGIGLGLALGSALVAIVAGDTFMTSQRLMLELPLIGHLDLSTPQLFDTGVYFVVLGVMMLIILNLAEDEQEEE